LVYNLIFRHYSDWDRSTPSFRSISTF